LRKKTVQSQFEVLLNPGCFNVEVAGATSNVRRSAGATNGKRTDESAWRGSDHERKKTTRASTRKQAEKQKQKQKLDPAPRLYFDSGTWSVMGLKTKENLLHSHHSTLCSGSDKLMKVEAFCQNDFVS
jgi:hypothetical protein